MKYSDMVGKWPLLMQEVTSPAPDSKVRHDMNLLSLEEIYDMFYDLTLFLQKTEGEYRNEIFDYCYIHELNYWGLVNTVAWVHSTIEHEIHRQNHLSDYDISPDKLSEITERVIFYAKLAY